MSLGELRAKLAANLFGSGMLNNPEAYTQISAALKTETKGEPVMAKAELLPKDILVALESGDRTELFLDVAENDVPEGSIGSAFAQANQLGNAFANSSGSSFASAMTMQQMRSQQMAQMIRIDSGIDPAEVFKRLR